MKFKSESDYRPMNKLCPDRRLTARTQSASSVLQGAEIFCCIFALYFSPEWDVLVPVALFRRSIEMMIGWVQRLGIFFVGQTLLLKHTELPSISWEALCICFFLQINHSYKTNNASFYFIRWNFEIFHLIKWSIVCFVRMVMLLLCVVTHFFVLVSSRQKVLSY